jgi:hypothetical protein
MLDATATATYSDPTATATVSKPNPNPAAASFEPVLASQHSTEPVLASQARLCLRSQRQKTNLRSSSMQGTGPNVEAELAGANGRANGNPALGLAT